MAKDLRSVTGSLQTCIKPTVTVKLPQRTLNQVHLKRYLSGTSAIGPRIKEATLSFKVMSPASLTIPDILTDKGAWSYLAGH